MCWQHLCCAVQQKSTCKTWHPAPAPKTDFSLSQESFPHAHEALYRNQGRIRFEDLKRGSETSLSNHSIFQQNSYLPRQLPFPPWVTRAHVQIPSASFLPSLFPSPDTAWHVFYPHLNSLLITRYFGNRSSFSNSGCSGLTWACSNKELLGEVCSNIK